MAKVNNIEDAKKSLEQHLADSIIKTSNIKPAKFYGNHGVIILPNGQNTYFFDVTITSPNKGKAVYSVDHMGRAQVITSEQK